MAEPQVDAGNITLDLNGTEVILRPTMKACISLSSARGGMTVLTNRCLDMEFEAIQSVIVAGLGGKTSKDLPELIYRAGLINLSADCIRFLHIVSNGGQPPGADADESGEGDGSPLADSSQ